MPAVADGTEPVPAGEEAGPADPALDRASTTSAPSDPASSDPAAGEPAASEPAMPSDGSPAVDAAVSCAAMGGFTIAATSSCYMLGDNVFAWQDARNFCQAWGGDLVQIDSLEENAELARRNDGSAWIGANDQEEEGTFHWAGGAPLGYAGWSLNQPNNLNGNEDCGELPPFDEGWIDVPCTGDLARRALCERP